MRKLIVLLALAALVVGPAALAKERNVSMIGAPTAPKAGQAWTATISVKRDGRLSPGKAPIVRIVSAAGRAINVAARATPKAGIYRARVVFPSAGMWRVIVVDKETGRAYEFNRMKVRTTKSSPALLAAAQGKGAYEGSTLRYARWTFVTDGCSVVCQWSGRPSGACCHG